MKRYPCPSFCLFVAFLSALHAQQISVEDVVLANERNSRNCRFSASATNGEKWVLTMFQGSTAK